MTLKVQELLALVSGTDNESGPQLIRRLENGLMDVYKVLSVDGCPQLQVRNKHLEQELDSAKAREASAIQERDQLANTVERYQVQARTLFLQRGDLRTRIEKLSKTEAEARQAKEDQGKLETRVLVLQDRIEDLELQLGKAKEQETTAMRERDELSLQLKALQSSHQEQVKKLSAGAKDMAKQHKQHTTRMKEEIKRLKTKAQTAETFEIAYRHSETQLAVFLKTGIKTAKRNTALQADLERLRDVNTDLKRSLETEQAKTLELESGISELEGDILATERSFFEWERADCTLKAFDLYTWNSINDTLKDELHKSGFSNVTEILQKYDPDHEPHSDAEKLARFFAETFLSRDEFLLRKELTRRKLAAGRARHTEAHPVINRDQCRDLLLELDRNMDPVFLDKLLDHI